MAAKTKCPLCDEAVWGFDLTQHLFGHLPYQMPDYHHQIQGGHVCWCGKPFEQFGNWVSHLYESGGWKVHYAACALGLHREGRK